MSASIPVITYGVGHGQARHDVPRHCYRTSCRTRSVYAHHAIFTALKIRRVARRDQRTYLQARNQPQPPTLRLLSAFMSRAIRPCRWAQSLLARDLLTSKLERAIAFPVCVRRTELCVNESGDSQNFMSLISSVVKENEKALAIVRSARIYLIREYTSVSADP